MEEDGEQGAMLRDGGKKKKKEDAETSGLRAGRKGR